MPVKEATREQVRDRVYYQLGDGKKAARHSQDIAQTLHIKDRDVRKTIGDLTEQGIGIASSTSTFCGGFYVVTTREEADEYLESLKGRIIEIAKRMRAFKRATRTIRTPGQLPLV